MRWRLSAENIDGHDSQRFERNDKRNESVKDAAVLIPRQLPGKSIVSVAVDGIYGDAFRVRERSEDVGSGRRAPVRGWRNHGSDESGERGRRIRAGEAHVRCFAAVQGKSPICLK